MTPLSVSPRSRASTRRTAFDRCNEGTFISRCNRPSSADRSLLPAILAKLDLGQLAYRHRDHLVLPVNDPVLPLPGTDAQFAGWDDKGRFRSALYAVDGHDD